MLIKLGHNYHKNFSKSFSAERSCNPPVGGHTHRTDDETGTAQWTRSASLSGLCSRLTTDVAGRAFAVTKHMIACDPCAVLVSTSQYIWEHVRKPRMRVPRALGATTNKSSAMPFAGEKCGFV